METTNLSKGKQRDKKREILFVRSEAVDHACFKKQLSMDSTNTQAISGTNTEVNPRSTEVTAKDNANRAGQQGNEEQRGLQSFTIPKKPSLADSINNPNNPISRVSARAASINRGGSQQQY